ncbi:MAG: ribosomal protein S18-alanine N-acetyltransferase [Gemmatimonadaceae bacterium]
MSPITNRIAAIRAATMDDLSQVAAIERDSFGDPWPQQSFEEILRSGATIFLIATMAETKAIAGYVIGLTVADIGEILNLAVARPDRRQGVGGELLDAGISAVEAGGAREIFLEVRESNNAALGLYGSRGFAALARRSRYYRNPVEDALVLRRAVER